MFFLGANLRIAAIKTLALELKLLEHTITTENYPIWFSETFEYSDFVKLYISYYFVKNMFK